MKLLLFNLLLVSTISVFSQTKSINVEKTNFNLVEELSLKDQMLDPEFLMGKVIFKDGSTSKAFLNYNLITNSIMFLDEKKQAFVLEGLPQILLISYGKKSFMPINGKEVAEVVETYKNGTSLLLQRIAKTTNSTQNRGAYGTSTEHSATTRVTSTSDNSTLTTVDQSVEVKVTIQSNYILSIDGKMYPIKRLKDLKKLYASNWDNIKNYISINDLNVNDNLHVLLIIKYCNN